MRFSILRHIASCPLRRWNPALPPAAMEGAHSSSLLPACRSLKLQSRIARSRYCSEKKDSSVSADLRAWTSQCYYLSFFVYHRRRIIFSYFSWSFWSFSSVNYLRISFVPPSSFLNPLRLELVFLFSIFLFIPILFWAYLLDICHFINVSSMLVCIFFSPNISAI